MTSLAFEKQNAIGNEINVQRDPCTDQQAFLDLQRLERHAQRTSRDGFCDRPPLDARSNVTDGDWHYRWQGTFNRTADGFQHIVAGAIIPSHGPVAQAISTL